MAFTHVYSTSPMKIFIWNHIFDKCLTFMGEARRAYMLKIMSLFEMVLRLNGTSQNCHQQIYICTQIYCMLSGWSTTDFCIFVFELISLHTAKTINAHIYFNILVLLNTIIYHTIYSSTYRKIILPIFLLIKHNKSVATLCLLIAARFRFRFH